MKNKDWNKLVMVRHIWDICYNIGNSVWVNWISINHLKGKSIWDIRVVKDNPWWWRKLLQLRSDLKRKIKYRIGNGENTNLWMDNWHSLGHFLDRYGDRLLHDSSLNRIAKVKKIIYGETWNQTVANSCSLIEVIV